MGRFLCTAWPFPGHLHPMMAVADALRARGHDVGFYSGEAAREVVEAEGFVFFPFDHVAVRLQEIVDGEPNGGTGGDDDSFYERLTLRYAQSYDNRRLKLGGRMKDMYLEWCLGTVPQQIADLEPIISSWQPDAVLCDPMMWGPSLVLHEVYQLPVAIFSFFAGCLLPVRGAAPFGFGRPPPRSLLARIAGTLEAVGTAAVMQEVRSGVRGMRRTYGLPDRHESMMALMRRMPLYLVATAPEYDYSRNDLPPSVHYVGACLWDRPRQNASATWLDHLPVDSPIVYVSEGTSRVREAVLLQAASRGLAGGNLYAILTTGRHRNGSALGLVESPNVRIEHYVPHGDLFPHLAAVVTNGGSGTVRAALAAGLPLVVVPMEWDQFENAQRVVEAGVGVRLSLAQCTPSRLRAAVSRVLGDPSFRAEAQRLAAALERCGGPARAAALLEDLVQPTSVHRIHHDMGRVTAGVVPLQERSIGLGASSAGGVDQ